MASRTLADAIAEAKNAGATGDAEVRTIVNQVVASKAEVVAVSMPTSSAGGIANGAYQTVSSATAASTDTSAASLTSTNLAIDALKNNFQELNQTVTALLAALKA